MVVYLLPFGMLKGENNTTFLRRMFGCERCEVHLWRIQRSYIVCNVCERCEVHLCCTAAAVAVVPHLYCCAGAVEISEEVWVVICSLLTCVLDGTPT